MIGIWTSTTPTSRNRRGFTLIEMLIVIALMAFIFGVMIPGIGISVKATIQNSVRELATLIRAAYDESSLKGRVYRVAFDLDKNQYWVEQGPQNLSLMTDEQNEDESRKNARRTDDEKAAVKKPVFGLAKDVTRDKKSLPTGVKFSDIMNAQRKEPFTAGIVYAHIFPHGFMEKLTIHIKDTSGHEATLLTEPVSGKSRVFDSYIKDSEK